jgi:hypothetical protein
MKTVPSTDVRPSPLLRLLPGAMLLLLQLEQGPAAASAAAPPAVKWVKGYSFGKSESHPHAGVECADGGFLVVGDGQDYSNETVVKRYIYVLKTDRAGNAQWQQRFGDVAWNYGKFGIELADGSILVAGAMSTTAQAGTHGQAALQRTLLHLNGRTGALQQRLSLPNKGWEDNLKDGFMCVALGEDDNSVVATGFVGGENSTTGYVDEPMFLIGGGKPFAMKLSLKPRLAVTFDMTIEAPASAGFTPVQGMRLFHDAKRDAYIVSHTVRYLPNENYQFGLTSISSDGTVNWVQGYKAQPDDMHASHPYALTQALDGDYAIGGLATVPEDQTCEGRLVKIDPKGGDLIFDRRFKSAEKDTNIECYGLQVTPDGGFILTCGTGVEPELHPEDPQSSKIWGALVHRTDKEGMKVWEKTYTDRMKDDAGEYIVTTRSGEYAVYIDAQSWGSPSTGGNFAIMLLNAD